MEANLSLSRSARSASLDEVVSEVLATMTDAVDLAVIVTDADGVIELWNGAAEELYGWSAAEALGTPAIDLIVPVDQQLEAAEIRASFLGLSEWQGEFTCRHRNGSTFAVEVVDMPVLGPDGELRATVGVSRHPRDRFIAEREANTVQAMADASDHAVFTVDKGVILTWSHAAQRLLGWSADEAIGQPISMMLPEAHAEEAAALSQRVRNGESVESHLTERLAKDGSTVRISLSVTPVFDATSQTWRGVVAIRDQRTRDDIIEAAIAAEARFRSLLARSTEVVLVLDAEGRVRAVSSGVAMLLGIDPDELIGVHASDRIHPDDIARVREVLAEVVADKSLHPRLMYRRPTADAGWLWAEATLSNMLDDPLIAGIVVNIRDVHEREEARRRLELSESRLSAIVNRSSEVAMFFDVDGTIQWVSPAVAEVLGMCPKELTGRNGIEMIHPDDRERVIAEFMAGLGSAGDHMSVEFRINDPDGPVRWIEEVATNLLDDPTVGFVVANLRDITDRKLAADELARLALVDDLTGLPNRNALLEMVRDAGATMGADRTCGVIFFDIDDFADVNDALGHPVGDSLLIGIARRVESALDAGCRVARFGGDQFAVLCTDIEDLPDCLAVAASIQACLSAPFVIGGKEIFAVVSVGIATSQVDEVEALLRRADTALSQSKKAGRGQTVVFEPKLGTESRRRLHYAGELRRAIGRGEITASYQPVLDLNTGRVVAVEALARWHHAGLGEISPAVFIPLAEATGSISELGGQILRQSCVDAASWMTAGRRLRVAVNASAVQLMDQTYPDQVIAALESAGLEAEQLSIEITETAALRDLAGASRTLAALRDKGVQLSLDDFGTGYSSLSLLKRLPVSALKIDRSFVSGLGGSVDDDQIVTGVVQLALALGFEVIGEGVETPDQAERLRQLGCQLAQGFLWSKAVPAGVLLETIRHIESSTVTPG